MRGFYLQPGERLEELGGGVIVHADDCIVRISGAEVSGEFHVARISREKKLLRDANAVGEHRSDGAGLAGLGGSRGKRAGDKCEAARTELDEMLGKQVAAGEVVDADEVEVATMRERADVAIEEDDRNACITEALRDSPIRHFVIRRVFKGREEHAAHAVFDVAEAEFLGLIDAHACTGLRAGAAAPVHPEIVHAGKACEFAADDVKNLNLAETGDNHSELPDAGWLRTAILAEVGAGACFAIEDALDF